MIKKLLFTYSFLSFTLISFAQTWTEVLKQEATSPNTSDYYGRSVSISGDYAIVGASGNNYDETDEGASLNNAGAVYILKKTGGTWAHVQKVVSSDRKASDSYGVAVAMDGDYAVIGATGQNYDASGGGTSVNSAGAVYVLKNISGTWTQVQKLVASDRQSSDNFGAKVDIDGDYIVVGCYGHDYDVAGGNNLTGAGAVYIYKKTAGVWGQEQKIVNSDRTKFDYFGRDVAIDDDYIIVGASGADTDESGADSTSKAGAVYVLKNNTGTWTEVQKLVTSDRREDDNFGYYLDMDGDYAVIGAYGQDYDASGNGVKMSTAGAAYIFKNNAGTWSEVQKIVASDRSADSEFGEDVAIDGDYIVVGANENDTDVDDLNTLNNAGAAYVFKNNAGTWSEEKKITASGRVTNDKFGERVQIEGESIIIGVRFRDDNGYSGSGSIYIFEKVQLYSELALYGNDKKICSSCEPTISNLTHFGKLAAGSSDAHIFTIKNEGTGALSLTGSPAVSISGSSDFTITSQPGSTTLAQGATTTFVITFTPTVTGLQKATVMIESNDTNSPFTFYIQGETNTALNFDGLDDEVSIANMSDNLQNTDFTLEFWMNMTDATTTGGVFTIEPSVPLGNLFYVDISPDVSGMQLQFQLDGNTGSKLHTLSNLPNNTWGHFAFIKEGDVLTVYRNGVASGSSSGAGPGQFSVPGKPLLIGSGPSGAFKGHLDEVRIWDRALCLAEIQGRMNNCLQGNENGLIAYYNFEEGTPTANNTSITKVKDIAGVNHGMLNDFTQNGGTSNWVSGNNLKDDGLVTATSITWLGTTDNWNLASNWNPANVPTQCNDVIIPATSNNPTFSDNQAVNSIEIQGGAALTLGAGGCLWVGSAFVNNGDFVLEATSSAYAQYLGPQVEGTLEQSIGEKGWHSIASPFIDATLGDISFDQGGELIYDSNPLKCNVHYYDPGTWQQTPPNSWSEAWGTWVAASGNDEPFSGSRAYNVYFDKNFMTGSFPITMTVTGTLRNTPVTQQLNGANGGWNTLSNPFPSAVSWEKLYDNSEIQPYYYVWDAALDNWRAIAGDGTSVPASPALSAQYIAPYQSVFVRTVSGQSTNSGDEADNFQDHTTSNADRPSSCVAASSIPFYKTSATGVLRLKASNNTGLTDELLIRFNDKYITGYDYQEDASKFFSLNRNTPSVYAQLEDEKACVISSYPYPALNAESIALGYSSIIRSNVTFTLTESNNDLVVLLEDMQLGVFHNMKRPYLFTHQKELVDNRFKLHVGTKNSNIYSYASSDQFVYVKDNTMVFYSNPQLEGGSFTFFNLAGQELLKGKVKQQQRINLSGYVKGIYLLMISHEGKVQYQRVMIP